MRFSSLISSWLGKYEDLTYAQVHAPFAGANVANPLQQFVEVVGDARTFGRQVLEPLVVHGESLHQILAQTLRRPTAELGSTVRPHAVTHCENEVEIVVLDLALHLPRSLPANYSESPNS